MNRDETEKIIFVLRAQYPEYYARLSRDDVELSMQTWHKLLNDFTYEQVSAGLEMYIRNDIYGRAPKVGQIIAAIQKLDPPKDNANEAWAQVYKAIGRSSYYAEEEFNKLDPIVQKAVGSPANLREYASMNINDVSVTVKAHFKSVYETELKRQEELAKLPQEMRDKLAQEEQKKIGG